MTTEDTMLSGGQEGGVATAEARQGRRDPENDSLRKIWESMAAMAPTWTFCWT